MRFSISCGRMIIDDLREELIKDSCFDTLFPLEIDRDCMFEDTIDFFAIDRLREYDRRIREKVKLLSHVFHISIEDRLPIDSRLIENAIPLVHDEDNPLLGFDRTTSNMQILMRNTLNRIDHDCDDIGAIDRALSPEYTPLLDIRRSDFSRATNPRSIDETYFLSFPRDHRIDRVSCRPRKILDDRASCP